MGITASKSNSGGIRSTRPDSNKLWWHSPKEDVARRLKTWCDNIELISFPVRWANLTFYRMMTGRATGPSSYNYSAVARPSSLTAFYSRANFAACKYNILAQCSDALHARVYCHQPFPFVVPIDGDFKARVKSKKLTRFLDAAFYELKLWEIIEQLGLDCRTWGTAFLKVDASLDKKTIECTRVLGDEVIVDDNELNASNQPRRLAIRLFVNRDVMYHVVKGNVEAENAVKNAPKSENGFAFGTQLDTTDVIVLREAWSLPTGDAPGRHVLSVGDFALVDEKYERDHFPVARLIFNNMNTGYFGQGMPEMVLGLVKSLDFQLAAIDENHRRASWPRIIRFNGSNVNQGSLGDQSNGIVDCAAPGLEPKFIFPEAVSPGQYQFVNQIISMIKERFRLNDQAANGQKPKFTSGAAIEKEDEINDAAHLPEGKHLERCVLEIARLVIEAAEIVKPVVRLPGRRVQEIKWTDAMMDSDAYDLRVLPVSQLSQTAAYRQQQIDTWFAEGVISKAWKMRLEQVPDTEGFLTLTNASLDYIEWALDSMVEDGVYTPAEPWVDLGQALETAQSRYLVEKRQKTPQDRLDLILQWMSQIQEMIEEAGAATAPAPASGFGIQPPPGPGPAPSKFPVAPAMAPPAPVQPQ
jgi:hypothetical protein